MVSNPDTGQVLFDRDGVIVTTRRLVWRGATIPIRSIASVDSYSIKPSLKGPTVLFCIAGLLLLATQWIMGLLLFGTGIAWGISRRPKYAVAVRLTSGSGEELSSQDPGFVSAIVDALNAALAAE